MGDTTQALRDQIKAAAEKGAPLCIVGGGSKAFYGREPSGEVLPIAGHAGLVAYEAGELVMTVRAGTRLAEIEAALGEKGQALAFEPPDHDGHATIGGVLACNLSGPARPWAGSGRDMVLGVKLIDGRGDLLSFGGKVMKNVAGYDVSRLQCGGLGCFGLLTEVSLKVLPVKPVNKCLVAPSLDPDSAIKWMNELSGRALPISGAAWLDGAAHVRLQGGPESVATARAQIRRLAPQIDFKDDDPLFWAGLRHQRLNFFATQQPIWRFSVKSTAPHILQDAPWLIDWAGAQRWLKGGFDQAELERLARAAGGTVSCFRNGLRSGEVFHSPDSVTRRLQSNLKVAFDPLHLFNPGRLYSWL